LGYLVLSVDIAGRLTKELGIQVNIFHMSDIQWTKEFLMLPGSRKRYSLHHLYINADSGFVVEDDSVTEGITREYFVLHHRTQELICQIRVSEREQKDYRAFENQLVTSRL
jgi:hypothetical protein